MAMRSERTKKPVLARLLAGIDASGGPDACHPWRRCLNEHGYGVINIGNNTTRLAHRHLWELTHDVKLIREQTICHRCDNPICCNLAHLFIGTQADNVADMRAKNRESYSGLLGVNGENKRGVDHGMAKLTARLVREIRKIGATRSITQREIAAKYGISQSVVSEIISRRAWSHI